jgi:5-methylcytosine-specific restriction endonuclease McrA
MASPAFTAERGDAPAIPAARKNRRLKSLVTNRCLRCGSGFQVVMERAKYCSIACRSQAKWSEAKPIQHTCTVCEAPFESKQTKAFCCSHACTKVRQKEARDQQSIRDRKWTNVLEKWTHANNMRRARTAGSETFRRAEIFDRDRWICGLCGKKVNRQLKFPDSGSASLDHIVPLSEGGAHSRANTQIAHLGCNSRKQAGPGGQTRLFG